MSKLIIPIIFLLAFSVNADPRPVPVSEWDNETKLWLARSCAGESGIHAHEECIGIAWTYATRSQETGMPFLKLVKKYSSAIKPHEKHRRKWIFELELNSRKPEHWPTGLKWSVYRYYWKKILDILDQWALGEIPNPVPGANHFGGEMDTPNIKWISIEPISTKAFKNKFYRAFKE